MKIKISGISNGLMAFEEKLLSLVKYPVHVELTADMSSTNITFYNLSIYRTSSTAALLFNGRDRDVDKLLQNAIEHISKQL